MSLFCVCNPPPASSLPKLPLHRYALIYLLHFVVLNYDCTGIVTSVHLAEKGSLDHLHVQYVIADRFVPNLFEPCQVYVNVDCLSFSFAAEAETWLDTLSG